MEYHIIDEIVTTVKRKGKEGQSPYLEIGDIDIVTKKYSLKDKLSVSNPVIGEKDNIIISKVRPTRGAISILRENLLVSNAFSVLKAKESVIPKYLFYILSYNKSFIKHLGTRQVGSSYPSCRENDILDFKVPICSLESQMKITTILEKADELRQIDRKILDKYDRLAQGLFLEMFGDPKTNIKGFKVDILNNYLINDKDGTKCGPFGSALKKDEYQPLGIPVWTMDNIIGMNFSAKPNLFITQKKYNDLKSYRVSNGDIIISRAGTVGKMCVVESEFKDSIISTNLIRLKLNPDKLLPIYFVALMNYARGRVGRLRTGEDGAFTHMNTGILNKLTFPIPPITIQRKYLEIINKINFQKQLTQQSLQKCEELFQSLLQRAFRGELV